MHTATHPPVRGARRRTAVSAWRALVVLALTSACSTASVHFVPASAASTSGSAESAYGWPVKPFDRPHPVRGNFGDPRTTFHAPPTMRGLMAGDGSFSFHFGVDIAVADGTPVYPVRSGVATLRGGRTVHVESGNGFATQYWHIIPAIASGQQVVEGKTVLGHVMKGYEHVHFSELENGRAVNPLAPGHMGPYADSTAPTVTAISFRRGGAEVLPEFVHGRLDVVARISDVPALRVPGIWRDLPVAPAVITWRVERVADGRRVMREATSYDVRRTLPDDDAFWHYYARGSRQNMSTFNSRRAWRQPGVYLYDLTRAPLDTSRLANGIYRLVVTAGDIRGNRGTTTQNFIVRNAK